MTELDFMTPESFYKEISVICSEHSMTYIDAVLSYCEDNDLDVEEILPLISRPLKERIKVDASNNGYMKKTASLPL